MSGDIPEELKTDAEPVHVPGKGLASATFTDLAAAAHVIALGEPTHGQGEINTLRHHLSARLIEDLGFTTVALEAPASRCSQANDWIHGRGGDPAEVPLNLGYWMYATREYRDLFLWLREENARRSQDKRISLMGIDLESTEGVSWSGRDRLMAENVLRRVEAGERVILWAHNGHVTKDAEWLWDPAQTPMGAVLARELGDRYVAVGSFFGEGSFLAYSLADAPPRLTAFPVMPLPGDTLDAILAGLNDAAVTLLNLRNLTPALHDLLDRPLATRIIGAAGGDPEELIARPNVVRCFDAICFVRHATASRLIHWV